MRRFALSVASLALVALFAGPSGPVQAKVLHTKHPVAYSVKHPIRATQKAMHHAGARTRLHPIKATKHHLKKHR